jgi:multidrug efflux pump subunit AcrA (membrane-fusion protein)
MPIAAGIGLLMQYKGQQQQQQAAAEQQRLAEAQAAESRAAAAKQREIDKRRADLANSQSIRTAIRNQRTAYGQRTNLAGLSGTMASSGYAGGTSAQGATFAGDLQLFRSQAGIQEQQSNLAYSMADSAATFSASYAAAGNQAAQGAGLVNLGSTIFTAAGGSATLFGGNKGQQPGATRAT